MTRECSMAGWRWLASVGLVLNLAAGLASAAQAPGSGRSDETVETQPQRRALLIGINDYVVNDDPGSSMSTSFPDLNGAVNDVRLLSSLLESRFGFPRANIETLVDSAATREAVLSRLRSLVSRTKRGDAVYVHFSGHGSQVRDANGDEEDGYDETILPYDARTPGIADITDDELGSILAGLPSENVLVVLDSCHSGTATRGETRFTTRAVPPDGRAGLYDAPRDVRTRGVDESRWSYLLMTGAGEQESALDGPMGGAYYGFFSYAFADALRGTPDSVTAREIHQSVSRSFERLGRRIGQISVPRPQLEGPPRLLDRALLTLAPAEAIAEDTAERPRLPYLVTRSASEGRVKLSGQLPPDGGPGALWAVYAPGETVFAPGSAGAIVEMLASGGEELEARLVQPPAARIRDGSRAVLLTAAPPTADANVTLGRVPQELAEPLKRRLQELGIEVSTGHSTRSRASADALEFVVDVQDGDVRITTAGGLQRVGRFSWSGIDGSAGRIARIVRRSLSVRELLALENRAARLSLDVRVVPSEGGAVRAVEVIGASDIPAYRVRGDAPRSPANSLMVEIEASEDCFVTIINIDTEGGVQILFPTDRTDRVGFFPQGRIPGGQRVRIPDSLSAQNRARIWWDIVPPAGVDTLQVFASTDLPTASKIREFITGVKNVADRGLLTRGAEPAPSALRSLSRELARRSVDRGIAVVEAGTQGDGSGPHADLERPDTGAPAAASSPEEAGTADEPQGGVAGFEPDAIEPSAPGPGDWTSRTVTFVVEDR